MIFLHSISLHFKISLKSSIKTLSVSLYFSLAFMSFLSNNMYQDPSSSKKMLDSLNKIDLVAFFTSSKVLYLSKPLTIPPVNIGSLSPPNPLSPFYINNLAPSFRPGPCSLVLNFLGRPSYDQVVRVESLTCIGRKC